MQRLRNDHQQATFTRRDLVMFTHRHSDGKQQFDWAMSAVRASPNLVELGKDGRGENRFTSRDMIETEQRLQRASELMAERERHRVDEKEHAAALARAESQTFGKLARGSCRPIARKRGMRLPARPTCCATIARPSRNAMDGQANRISKL